MARLLFGGSSDDYAADLIGRPVIGRRVRFYTSAAMTTEITDLASDAAGTGAPLTVTTDARGYWGPVYGTDGTTVMYAGTVDSAGAAPAAVVAVYTHSSTGVVSLNGRTGAVSLTKTDVTGTGVAAADVGADAAGAATTAQAAAIAAAKGLPLAPTGATQPTRYVGRWAATGAPASGTFAVGDFGFDGVNTVQLCTAAGSPGTWVASGSAAYLSVLGPSNGTDDSATLQAALTAVRAAGTAGRVVGKPGENYIVAAESIISSDTYLDLRGCTVTVKAGTNARFLRNYAHANPAGTAADGAVTSGSNVVTTSLAASAAVGQTLIVAGAGGNGNGPLVGKVSAVGGGTVTLKTLDGRACNATATVASAAVTLCNRDTNIRAEVGKLVNGNNTANTPYGYGVIFMRHVDGLHIDIDSYTSSAVSRGVGLGSITGFWLRVGNAVSSSVVAQINGPAAHGRVDTIRGAAGDDLFAFTGGDYSAQQSTAGDIIDVTVGTVRAFDTSLNVFKVLAGTGWLVDGIKVDGEIAGTGASAGIYIGDDPSQVQTQGGTYGEIDLGYVNLRTTSYPIALVQPNAKRIKATVRHVPTDGGLTQEVVSIGGSGSATIEELDLSGSVSGSTRGLINVNNTSVTIKKLTQSDGVAGYRQVPVPTAANILAARVPIAPFVMGEAWSKADAAALGNVESSGVAWTVWAGVPGIVSRQAAPTTTTNTKAVTTGVADGYTEIIVNALSSATGEAWLVIRGSDTSNYVRFGWTAGSPPSMVMQKVVAGAVTQIMSSGATFSPVTFTAGTRLGVLHVGSSYKAFVDGKQVGTTTDTFNNTATLVGWQSSDTPARFGPIYSRNLVNGA